MDRSEVLLNKFNEINIKLSDIQVDKFLLFYDLLINWNKKLNLTAITDYEEVIIKHYIDSLSIVNALDFDDDNNNNLIDIGTGAGFPSIPLKILFPDLNMVLLDSLNKRVSYLNEVISQLQLNNIQVIHGRAEDIGKIENYREQFDICVSRAVANLSTLSEYCIPFVKLNGKFIAYKSSKIDDEIKSSKKAINLLGGKINNIYKFILPTTDFERSFVIIDKVKNTPMEYPRKAGKPNKQPIV